jgi:hypothetical protein
MVVAFHGIGTPTLALLPKTERGHDNHGAEGHEEGQ